MSQNATTNSLRLNFKLVLMFDFNSNNLTESFEKTWVTDVDMRNVNNPGQVRNMDYFVPS
jgi:hypothetical protein